MSQIRTKFIQGYFASLIEPKFVPTALKVAGVVGSILFVINHGSALLQGNMGRDRWISAGLTYLVPYFVNIHGQYISLYRQQS
ncbi:MULTISPECIES: nitrate/nitrite transporter NrtS [unclassified Anabaena]|uniref:nitrate/nitrite transporter NrtS n=1 Tax=unclassified Anabaena TaxID=2619674 RepID=UPI000837210B|nr:MULTISPECIES: nitrate/nitrite transporter NrtS [unclassified Anabaena]